MCPGNLGCVQEIWDVSRKFGMCPGNLPKFAEAVAWVGGLAVSDDLYES